MIYGLFAALYGILMAFQSQLCVQLSNVYGNWFSAVTVHLVGLLLLTPLFLTAWGRRKEKSPWYIHVGGMMGVLTVVFSNFAIAQIGLTASNILMLLGQIICSVLLDSFGWLGSQKRRITLLKGAAIAIMTVGCLAMAILSGSMGSALPLLAILASLGRGFFLILSRGVNGMLARKTGTGYATWMNYATGLGASLLIFSLLGFPMDTAFPAANVPFWAYLAGMVGCIGIYLCNRAAPNLSSLNMAAIVFVSETGAALLIDALAGGVSIATIAGCIIVAAGMAVNLLSEKSTVSLQ